MSAPDFSQLTPALDFGTVTVAILLVYSALSVVYVSFKAAFLVLDAVRGQIGQRNYNRIVDGMTLDSMDGGNRVTSAEWNWALSSAAEKYRKG